MIGLRCDLGPLDQRLSGIRGLGIIGAPENSGKTALCGQIAFHVARLHAENDACVVFLCLDMPRQTVHERVCSHAAGIDYLVLKRGDPAVGNAEGPYLTWEQQTTLDGARRRMVEDGTAARLLVLDRGTIGEAFTAATLRQIVSDFKASTGCRRALVIIDYLQLLPVPPEVARLGDLQMARHQIQMVQQAVSAPHGTPEWECDAAIVISETRKPPNTGQPGGTHPDDLMGTARIKYAADWIIMVKRMTKADLQRYDRDRMAGLKVSCGDDKKSEAAMRRELDLAQKCPLVVTIAKGRDGMFRGSFALEFHYTTSTMTVLEEPKDAPASEEGASPQGQAPSRAEGPAERLEKLRRVIEDEATWAEDEWVTETKLRNDANLNSENGKEALGAWLEKGRLKRREGISKRNGRPTTFYARVDPREEMGI